MGALTSMVVLLAPPTASAEGAEGRQPLRPSTSPRVGYRTASDSRDGAASPSRSTSDVREPMTCPGRGGHPAAVGDCAAHEVVTDLRSTAEPLGDLPAHSPEVTAAAPHSR